MVIRTATTETEIRTRATTTRLQTVLTTVQIPASRTLLRTAQAIRIRFTTITRIQILQERARILVLQMADIIHMAASMELRHSLHMEQLAMALQITIRIAKTRRRATLLTHHTILTPTDMAILPMIRRHHECMSTMAQTVHLQRTEARLRVQDSLEPIKPQAKT